MATIKLRVGVNPVTFLASTEVLFSALSSWLNTANIDYIFAVSPAGSWVSYTPSKPAFGPQSFKPTTDGSAAGYIIVAKQAVSVDATYFVGSPIQVILPLSYQDLASVKTTDAGDITSGVFDEERLPSFVISNDDFSGDGTEQDPYALNPQSPTLLALVENAQPGPITGVPLETAQNFADIASSASPRFVQVLTDGGNGGGRTFYFHYGAGLLRLATTAVALPSGSTTPAPTTPTTPAPTMARTVGAWKNITTGLTTDASGGLYSTTAVPEPAGAEQTGRLGGTGSWFQWQVATNVYNSQGVIISLVGDTGDYYYNGSPEDFSARENQVQNGSTIYGAAGDVVDNTYIRITRVNTNDIVMSVSPDGTDANQRVIVTRPGVLAGVATPNPRIFGKVQAQPNRAIQKTAGYGLIFS